MENIREPAGETQTLVPRPRPATWTLAEAVKPLGRRRSSWVFLLMVSTVKHQVRDTYFSSIVFVLVTTSP